MEFVLREHQADRAGHHFDFHLQTDPRADIFESWAIRKGLPPTGVQHLAVKTYDHISETAFADGIIKSGYGKGTTHVVDSGEYLLLPSRSNARRVRLLGSIFRGDYTLYHWKGNQWLIRKVS